jgi:putative addiction module killer protein
MQDGPYKISQAHEFDEWMTDQTARTQVQIYKRLSKIREYGYFGDHKSVSSYEKGALKDVIWELRWDDGKRVYYAYIPERNIILLIGGNKNGQDQDVSKAKTIYLKTRSSPKTKK